MSWEKRQDGYHNIETIFLNPNRGIGKDKLIIFKANRPAGYPIVA